ncbi:MAG: twin-arginine translocase TatA/TatE family subunit [Flavobacteriales bacterium Tduv]
MILLFFSFEEGFFIVLVAVLLFGPKKIPEIARGLGEGLRQLRNATQEIKQEIWESGKKMEEPIQKIEEEVRDIRQDLNEDSSGPVKRKG